MSLVNIYFAVPELHAKGCFAVIPPFGYEGPLSSTARTAEDVNQVAGLRVQNFVLFL